MRILGLDPSLRSTGLCLLIDKEVQLTHTLHTYDLRGMTRLNYIADFLQDYLICKPDFVVMEGYAMGIKGGRVFDIGEMGYAYKRVLYKAGLETYIVPPTSMKKFVTGKGTAKKDQIQSSLLTTWDLDIQYEDEADAAGLALFGYYIKHRRLQRELSDDQRAALQKFELLT